MRVLLIEPDVARQRVWRIAAAEIGASLEVVASGRAGVAALLGGEWDTLITAIFMADVDGFEVIDTAKTMCPDTRIVASDRGSLLPMGGQDMLDTALLLGADSAIPVPVSAAVAVATLKNLSSVLPLDPRR